jgi:hypothetical protein
MKRLREIRAWFVEIVLHRPYRYHPEAKAIADPPPWDIPLDQTTAPLHREGDTTSV